MARAYEISQIISIALFFYYGIVCLVSQSMVAEFERFGLARFRRLTGALEVMGALGLLAGYFVPLLTLVASGGLTLLMVFGVAARIRIHDSVVEMLPALILMLVNLFIFLHAGQRLQLFHVTP
jgi:DoxX-like family